MSLVAIREHTQIVSNPSGDHVHGTVSPEPTPVSAQVVVIENIHVFYHPLIALAIVVVPGAMTTSFLRPKVYHLSGEVSWVGQA